MTISAAFAAANSGLTGIAAQFAVISQNVANASTPGYAREVMASASIAADGAGIGIQTGVATRQMDTQLEAEMFSANGTLGALQTRQSALQQIDAVQGAPGGGGDLSSLLGQLSASFSNLQTDPSNQASQGEVVNAAAALTGQINALSAAYTQGRQNAQDTIVSSVSALNGAAATIGQLSDQIVELQAAGKSTADLGNQRAQAMQTMSSLIDVRFIPQANGDMLAATDTGLTIPLHATTAPFATSAANIGPESTCPASSPPVTLNGTDVTDQIGGGQLGAAIALRDSTLPTYQAALDEFAMTLSNRFDAQGLTLFAQPSGALPASGGTPAQSGYVGYSASITVNPAVAADPALVRDGTHAVAGSATGPSAFTPNPPGGPAGFSGMIGRVLSDALGAEAQTGVAQPAPATSGLGPSGTLALPFAAPADLASFATAVMSSQASDSASTTTEASNEQAVQQAMQSKVSAGSAVNIDTEMSNMVQLQSAYGANAKLLTTLQSLWTDVLQMVP